MSFLNKSSNHKYRNIKIIDFSKKKDSETNQSGSSGILSSNPYKNIQINSQRPSGGCNCGRK
jgi:hypothetical protein